MPTTAEQQLALELINQARLDPEGEYDRLVTNADPAVLSALNYFNVDLVELAAQFASYSAVSALAWNDNLATSASNQNDLMNEFDAQGHFLGDQTPATFADRFTDAGYTGFQALGENIYAYTTDPDYAHAGFYIDWGNTPTGIQTPAGHRESIMSENYTEVGIGWTASDPGNNIGPFITTQHFGTTFSYDAQLLGVVIDDLDNDDFYDIGEGMGGITVTAVGTSGEGTFVTTSWASGGYQMVVPNGVYTVTFSGGGLTGTYSTTVTMAGENVKLDAEADDAVGGGLTLTGDAWADTLTGGAFDDVIYGGGGRDIVSGEGGNDTIFGENGYDILEGGDGDDVIDGGDGNDRLYGGNGNDDLDGGIRVDSLYGNAGHDMIDGGDSTDYLFGGSGDDTVFGGSGDDTLYGHSGNDTLDGGYGGDRIYGGNGDDTVSGGLGKDVLFGGTGVDILDGDDSNDKLYGNSGEDILFGGAGNDQLYGGTYSDVLSGGAGDDILKGSNGSDILTGGTGNDILHGGTGADTFIFDLGHEADVVQSLNIVDTLQISVALANGLSAAQIAASADVTTGSAVIDFGNGDTITLENFTDTAALSSMINIV